MPGKHKTMQAHSNQADSGLTSLISYPHPHPQARDPHRVRYHFQEVSNQQARPIDEERRL